MKKIYLTPDMEVVKMQTMTVLAASENLPTEGTPVDNNEGDASRWFDNGGSEDW